MMRIEDLWTSLRREALEAQRRVDATHPLDLYADFEPPDHPGLVLVCDERPKDALSLHAIAVERRRRSDGRWSLRIYLTEPHLLPVFAELCRDIIDFTHKNGQTAQPSVLVLSRIERWRSLMLPEPKSLSRAELRGLIGELIVLESELLPVLTPEEAVAAWTGPLGASQDFRLPNGCKIEVKAVDRYSNRVLINGLNQLDSGADPLHLVLVRLEDTGIDAEGALTAGRLIGRLRTRLAESPTALQAFETLLGFLGWVDTADADHVIVRHDRTERFNVDDRFPRLTATNVPAGVVAATYELLIPQQSVAS